MQQCAKAVKNLDGKEGCKGKYFFFESHGYCNCPKDDCTESANGNAGGSGQFYEFATGSTKPEARCERPKSLPANSVLVVSKCPEHGKQQEGTSQPASTCALACKNGFHSSADSTPFKCLADGKSTTASYQGGKITCTGGDVVVWFCVCYIANFQLTFVCCEFHLSLLNRLSECVWSRVCMCVCERERDRQREAERESVCVCACVCVCVCVCAYAPLCRQMSRQ